jgi:hypothetical protein
MFCNVVLYCFTRKGFICNKDYYYSNFVHFSRKKKEKNTTLSEQLQKSNRKITEMYTTIEPSKPNLA